MSEANHISLYKLNEYVRQVIDINFDEYIKVKAEINQVNNSRGHYYIELVEKDPDTDQLVARQSAAMWRNTAIFLQRKYSGLFDDLMQAGNEVVFSCKVDFHPVYGLKLIIHDLDASFTLGELERKKRAALTYLQTHRLIEINKGKPIPAAIQRIAVISSRTAAGYADFVDQLVNNPYEHGYQIDLYHSAVQGAATVSEVVQNLERIADRHDRYDIVCIMRGGGSKIDLAAFDELDIAKAIVDMPIPVITGIGHEIDTSIADVVAHTSVKTPTAIANFILHHNESFLDNVWNTAHQIMQTGRETLVRQHRNMRDLAYRLHVTSSRYFQSKASSLDAMNMQLQFASKHYFDRLGNTLERLTIQLDHLRPDNILKRGYSITLQAGKIITDASQVDKEVEIETILLSGSILSTVKELKDAKENDV